MATFFGLANAAPTVTRKTIADLDLAKAFATKTPWRLLATQGPDVPDEPYPGGASPGVVRLCLKTGERECRIALPGLGHHPWAPLEVDAHFLRAASVVYPRGSSAPPLLLLRTAGLYSGDGDQFVFTRLLAYRAQTDRFEQVYGKETGHNRNEEVRFVNAGPLAGDMISAEPTDNAPYGFWITVSRLTPEYSYRQILRYRSATHYGDGNPLAVIDSEMPNIQSRLGVWRSGAPPPLPDGPCPRPRLVRSELWCR